MIYEDYLDIRSALARKNLKKTEPSQEPMGSCEACPSIQKGTFHLLEKGDIFTCYQHEHKGYAILLAFA